MTDYVFSNNASGLLASGITSTDTTITLEAGKGALFPTPGTNEIATVTLVDIAGHVEICTYTDRTGDLLEGVTRGTEGTSAQTWAAGAVVSNRLTAAAIAEFLSRGATFEALNDRGDVGPGANQVAKGDHDHDSRYELIDPQIVRRNDALINFLGDVSINGQSIATQQGYFESSEVAVPAANGVVSVNHGLGVVPKLWQVMLRCVDLDDVFNPDDEVMFDGHYRLDGLRLTSLANDTRMQLYFYYYTNWIWLSNGGSIPVQIDRSKWRLVFRAWA